MHRRKFLESCGAAAGAACLLPRTLGAKKAPASPTTPSQRPLNFIVIVADDVCPAYLGCMGGPTPTPELDRLAREGVRFRRAYAVAPLCNPSRFTLLTGQAPGRNPALRASFPADEPYAIRQNTTLTEASPTIFRTLEKSGYLTGFTGKWHSSFELGQLPAIPQTVNLEAPDTDRLLREHQTALGAAIARLSGCSRASCIVTGNLDAGPRPPGLDEHQTEWITQGALDFLDEACTGSRPFFLHLANTLPHGPDLLKSLGRELRYTYGGRLENPPACHPPRASVLERLRQAGLPLSGPLGSINAGMIQMDDQLKAIRQKLREHGQEENTVLVFLADHGIYGKGTCYAPGCQVPLLISCPGQGQGGRLIETPVSLLDLVPTVLDLAGCPPSAEVPLDGRSLTPLLKGQGQLDRAAVYVEMGVTRGVISENWQYLELRYPQKTLDELALGQADLLPDHQNLTPGTFGPLNIPFKPGYHDPDQFYDLGADPYARRNLIGEVGAQPAIATARACLGEYLHRLGGAFPREVPAFMKSQEYRRLAEGSRQHAATKDHYPEGSDAEVIFNQNGRDPLAVY